MSVPTSELRDYLAKTGKALQTVSRLVKVIDTLEKSPVDNVYRIEKLVGEVQKATAGLPPEGETKRKLDDWLAGCISRLQAHKGELRRAFGVSRESLLKEQGFELKGQYPELRAGFYGIDLDFVKAQATIWYGPKQELMSKARLSPSEVAKQVQRTHKALTSRPLNEEGFLKKLHEAYLRTLSKMGRKEGEHAPILQVLAEYVFLEQDRRFYAEPHHLFENTLFGARGGMILQGE